LPRLAAAAGFLLPVQQLHLALGLIHRLVLMLIVCVAQKMHSMEMHFLRRLELVRLLLVLTLFGVAGLPQRPGLLLLLLLWCSHEHERQPCCKPDCFHSILPVIGRNLQCEPVRKWTPERNAIGRTPGRLKRAGVGTNGILECKCLSKTPHRTNNTVAIFILSVGVSFPYCTRHCGFLCSIICTFSIHITCNILFSFLLCAVGQERERSFFVLVVG
jgi:hypothetical protein